MGPKTPKLQKGLGAMKSNVTLLMQPTVGPTRKKAIITIARKNNITRQEAQFRQATRIAQNLARKK